jgi:hypothetical protein
MSFNMQTNAPATNLGSRLRGNDGSDETYRRKKTGPQAGFFNCAKLITSKQPEQQQPKQRQRQPKQPKQQPKRPKQQLQQQPERPEQRWCQQPERPEQQPEQQRWCQRPEQQQELLLSCCKQPEQQPAGRRSAGIFS